MELRFGVDSEENLREMERSRTEPDQNFSHRQTNTEIINDVLRQVLAAERSSTADRIRRAGIIYD